MAGQTPKVTTDGGVKAFNCRNCGGQVEVRAPGQTLVAVCRHCGSLADLNDPNYKVIRKYNQKARHNIAIPIGARGMLKGRLWECIGYMEREVRKWNYVWEEFLLFNPIHGFRFLVHASGHWSLAAPMIERPRVLPARGGVILNGEKFKFFVSGDATVNYVMGEFYWQVRVGQSVRTMDYIRPPYVLSVEKDQGGMVWSKGEYVTQGELREAFGKELRLRSPSGVAANQPNKLKKAFFSVLPVWIGALALLIALSVAGGARMQGETLMTQTHIVTKPKETVALGEVVVPESGNLEYNLSTDLDNDWVEIEGALTEKTTGRVYGFFLTTEYYHGQDSDGSWSEGSRSNWAVINDMEPGTYNLVLDIYANENKGTEIIGTNYRPIRLIMAVRNNVFILSNLIIFILLISLVPGILWGLSFAFERRRWAESE